MLTTRTARWSAVTGLVCVIVLVTTWFVLVGPRRSEAADLADQQAAAESTNVSLEAQIRSLEKEFGSLPEKRQQLAAIRRQLPPAADVAALVRTISAFADDAGVRLESITPGTATTLVPASDAAPGVVSISVTIEASGRYVEDALFLKYLQTMKRVYLVTEVSASRGGNGTLTSATTAASVPTTPSPTTSATATPSVTATPSTTASASVVDAFELKVTGEVFSLVDAATATPTTSPTTAP